MKAEEVKRALEAAVKGDTGDPTIFDKILAKEIPSKAIHDDELCYAFADISPQAPTHVLLIPKIRAGLTKISNATADHAGLLGHMMVQAAKIGAESCPDGFRLVVNSACLCTVQMHAAHLCPNARCPSVSPPACAVHLRRRRRRRPICVPPAHSHSRRTSDELAARLIATLARHGSQLPPDPIHIFGLAFVFDSGAYHQSLTWAILSSMLPYILDDRHL